MMPVTTIIAITTIETMIIAILITMIVVTRKIKGGKNRPQSLLSTSITKKNRVKHRNEQYLQQKAEAERKAGSSDCYRNRIVRSFNC